MHLVYMVLTLKNSNNSFVFIWLLYSFYMAFMDMHIDLHLIEPKNESGVKRTSHKENHACLNIPLKTLKKPP
jgi:hypothetical protein